MKRFYYLVLFLSIVAMTGCGRTSSLNDTQSEATEVVEETEKAVPATEYFDEDVEVVDVCVQNADVIQDCVKDYEGVEIDVANPISVTHQMALWEFEYNEQWYYVVAITDLSEGTIASVYAYEADY